MKILFLGETYRADAKTWIEGIETFSGLKVETMEVPFSPYRWKRMVLFFQFLIRLIGLRMKESYDIVLAERATSYGFFSLLVRARVKIVAQQGITDAFPEEGFSGTYKRVFQRLVYKNVNLVHAWGHVMTYAMLETGASPSKIMVKPKGINLERYTFPNQENENQIPLGIVTRSLSEIYRHDMILESLAILKKRNILVACWIVGDGVLKEKLHTLAGRLDIMDQVNFLGKIENKDLPSLLHQADFYLAVPETEGVSASLFEAMACGCYPIVTDLPANRAFIRPGQNGMLVPTGNPEKLADMIELFLKRRNSLTHFLEENRAYIESEVDFNKNMKQIWSRYQALLKK